ncbi:MAG: GNAT family N-acetyltransferase [Deltaproteobacteria bacterium]|nr:GNAT family N-acetyltransferase [Deltaproteobacteria bacterium]
MLPAPTLLWRAATPADDDAVVALSLALYVEDPATDPVPAEHTRRTLEALRARPARGQVVVLEVAGAVCGFALLVSVWSNELGGEVCSIDELYVAPSARGGGHGSALLEALARAAPPCPPEAVALALEVTPDNTRARALYQRLGFRGKNLHLRRRLTR